MVRVGDQSKSTKQSTKSWTDAAAGDTETSLATEIQPHAASQSPSNDNDDTQDDDDDDGPLTESCGSGGQLKPLRLELTPESQLDSTEPVCVELLDCDVSVRKVLKWLTSASWYVAQSVLVYIISDV